MKYHKRSNSRARMTGLSLIEIMVSLVIGLVVVGAVLVSYIGSGQTNKRQAAYGEMNENAQIALSLMKNDLLLAGYSQAVGTVTAGAPAVTTFVKTYSGQPIFGCDDGFANPKAATGAAVCAGITATTATPALEVRYEADLTNTVPAGTAPAPVTPSDCKGNGLTAQTVTVGANTTTYFIVNNRYYLANSAIGRSELHCASNVTTSGAQPLVEDVEALRFWYGEANAADPRQIVRYVAASANPVWNNIVSVRICVLMRSSSKVLTGEDTAAGTAGYLDCDSTARTSADGYLRRAYFVTTTLRNKMTF